MIHITDTHIHLQDFNQDFALPLLSSPNINHLILISANSNDFNKISTLYHLHNTKITPSFGYHPWEANNTYDLPLLEDYLKKHSTSLIGEIGLDGIKQPPSKEQHQLFTSQLDLAQKLNRPTIIHGAKALNELSKYIKQLSSIKYVYHSFSPNTELLKFLNKSNAFIGLGSSFINHPKAKEYFHLLALNKILFETDAPYQLKEENYLQNTTKNLIKLSNLSSIPLDELEEILINNTMEFIKC